MVNRLGAAVRRCAAAIAIDPSVEPAQNRCCFKRFFISVLLLLLLSNFESRTERVGLPVLPLLFPGCAESRISAAQQGVSGSYRKPGGGVEVDCGAAADFWKDRMRLQQQQRKSFFCEESFFFHIYDEEGGRAAWTLSIWLRSTVHMKRSEVIKPRFPTFFNATTAK